MPPKLGELVSPRGGRPEGAVVGAWPKKRRLVGALVPTAPSGSVPAT